ncbi:MAG: hypothetical protein LC134_07950 [Chitinophagales bacterium]|nr:hypothetical protein [Chitinophagales bacterium]
MNYTFITGGVLGYNNRFYCISKDDNNEVFIYKYNYETNTIKKLFPSLFSGNTGKLTRGVYNQLVGWRNSEVHGHSLLYFLSEISDEIYKIIDIKSNLLSIKMGYDNMLWGLGLEEDNTFAFYKINPYNGEYTLVYSFQKPANSNDYSDFTFDGGTVYIVGSQQLARISNLTVPVLNSNLSTFEKLNKLFNFNTCD